MQIRSVAGLYCGIALLLSGAAHCADYPTRASSRFQLLSSPLEPEVPGQCSDLSQDFAEQIARMQSDHSSCLQHAPADAYGGDESDGAGRCSKSTCQDLHTAIAAATRRSNVQTSLCRERLQAYLERQQRDEAARARRNAEAERQDREDAQTRAARDSEDRSERQQRVARTNAQNFEREEAARRAKQESGERDSARSIDRDRLGVAGEAARRVTFEATRESAKAMLEEAIAQARSQAISDVNDRINPVSKLLSSDVEDVNPFEQRVEDVKMAGLSSFNQVLQDFALGAALPLGARKHDSVYETITSLIDTGRSGALASNPFAAQVSGDALRGITTIHSRMANTIDEIARSVASVSLDAPLTVNNPGSARTFRPSRSLSTFSSPAGAESGQPEANPFVTGQPAGNPFEPPKSAMGAPRVLFRESVGHVPRSIDRRELLESDFNAGDALENGRLKCSTAGVGIVLQACEAQRAARSARPSASR